MTADRPDSGHDIERLLSRAAATVEVPGDGVAHTAEAVQARRRRRVMQRSVVTTCVLALAVGGAATQAFGGGLRNVVTPGAWPTGQPIPTGFPQSNSTTTLAPTDPAFNYYGAATTYADIADAGPTPEQLALLQDAHTALYTECMAEYGIVVDWPSAAESAARSAAENAVRAAAEERQARAFGDPIYAAEHGYGIDWQEWQDVVVSGGGGGGEMPELPPGMTEEEYSLIDVGPLDDYVDVAVLGNELGAPGSGCSFEAASSLYGDYTQWLRSSEWKGNILNKLPSFGPLYDPVLHDINQQWVACMAGSGYAGLKRQAEARSFATDAWSRGDPDAAKIERAVAVADAECVLSTGYPQVWQKTEADIVAQVKADPDVVAYGALIEAALPRAEEILAED